MSSMFPTKVTLYSDPFLKSLSVNPTVTRKSSCEYVRVDVAATQTVSERATRIVCVSCACGLDAKRAYCACSCHYSAREDK